MSILRPRGMKKFNPIEWMAWLYGKFFTHHTVLSYVAAGGLTGVLAVAFVLLLWARAIDKYEAENKPAPPTSVQQPSVITVPRQSRRSQPQPVPRTGTARHESVKKPPPVTLEQHGGPNVATFGDNSPVTVNPPTNPNAPVVFYDFQGVKHTQTGNKFEAVVGEQFTKFQEMQTLEGAQRWEDLRNLAESQISAVPSWLTPYLFKAEAEGRLGNRVGAVKLCEFVKETSGGNQDFDRAADKLLAQFR